MDRFLSALKEAAVDERENTFPMDVTDPGSRPRNWRPDGYLVVILAGADVADHAQVALVEGGFEPRDVKIYSGKQILENHDRYMVKRGPMAKIVGAIRDDAEGRDLYLGYAHEDRSALWLRVPDEGKVPKALRVLADHNSLHTRYYGAEKQTDFHMSS
jgi:hypothetical protein